MRDDMEIKREICEALASDLAIQPAKIGVEVSKGVVTLSGYVDNYFKKLAAEYAADRVPGVIGIEANLTVGYHSPVTVERTPE